MAKTAAEYKRAARAREKEALAVQPDAVNSHIKRPFSEFWKSLDEHQSDWALADESLASVGIEIPTFETDDDPLFHEFVTGDPDGYRGSLGKAERMAGALLDSYRVMASILNRYKREEIEARIAELEAADLTDPATRKQALADIVKLQKIKDKLGKEVRFSFPAFEIKGV